MRLWYDCVGIAEENEVDDNPWNMAGRRFENIPANLRPATFGQRFAGIFLNLVQVLGTVAPALNFNFCNYPISTNWLEIG